MIARHAVEGEGRGCGRPHVFVFGLGPGFKWVIVARLWLAGLHKWPCIRAF
jgi:hypothetical protein